MEIGKKWNRLQLTRRVSKEIEDILIEVAVEEGIRVDMVEAIHNAPFSLFRKHLTQGSKSGDNLLNLQIKYFGTFRVSEKKLKTRKERLENNEGF